MTRRDIAFVVAVCTRLGLVIPEASDVCAWTLLIRAVQEMRLATRDDVVQAKAHALLILLQFGWKEVFKASLTPQQTEFISDEEAGRFGHCLTSRVPKTEPVEQASLSSTSETAMRL